MIFDFIGGIFNGTLSGLLDQHKKLLLLRTRTCIFDVDG